MRTSRLAWVPLSLALGCGSLDPAALPRPAELRFNEIVSNNEGVFVDELGEADDYVELYNASDHTLRLSDYVIVDRSGQNSLPAVDLEPGKVSLLWADKSPEQGATHLGFKISADGEELALQKTTGEELDRVLVPPLAEHHAFSRLPDGIGPFADCTWASPARTNGWSCGPETPPPPPADLSFAPYTWPAPWPALPAPLAIAEAALKPADFVELVNTSDRALDLGDFELRLAEQNAGDAWPLASDGVALTLPKAKLGRGERVVVPVPESATAALAEVPEFHGVLALFHKDDGASVDRVDFSEWPDGAVLARPEPSGTFRFCAEATRGEPNTACSPLATREVGDNVTALLTPGDFHALAAGRGGVGTESVEFIVDLEAGGVVTFLNSADWDLHYTFIRERIDGDAHLDRCDPAERQEYNRGWLAFSQANYFVVDGRRYLLGTLVKYAGSDLSTVEFAPGDLISADQMKEAFFAVMAHLSDPEHWVIRPQAPDQIERISTAQGSVPIIGPNAPFRGVSFQALTTGKAFGTLRFVPADELADTPLGPRDIVVTDEVPNDIPLLGALVTETFQTPLAHVNILSRGRGTPNMALRDARLDKRLAPYFGKLVELDVSGQDFTVHDADPQAALDFWQSRLPSEVLRPRLDTSVRGVQSLADRGYADLPSIGGKAAQMAELERVPFCTTSAVSAPDRPFAIPVVHSLEHYQASGALALLDELRADPRFAADPLERERGLKRVRDLVQAYPLDRDLLREVTDAILARWSDRALRFRSSSNTEDLPGFSGAGLYTSEGLKVSELPDGIEDAIRTVWASLWERRAYDEREYSGVDQHAVAMAVLVHPAYKHERVNGVAISRDALQPTHSDRYYINAQVGEALVTNPAPGIESDELTYELYRSPRVVYHGHSTFSPDTPVISEAEAGFLACNLFQIHQYFRPILDPNEQNPWFAMDIEWKLMGDERALAIKQARSYSFGDEAPTAWCDF